MKTRGLFRAVEVLDELAKTERFAGRTIKVGDELMASFIHRLDSSDKDARRKYESGIWLQAYDHARRMLELEAFEEDTQETEIVMEFKSGQ